METTSQLLDRAKNVENLSLGDALDLAQDLGALLDIGAPRWAEIDAAWCKVCDYTRSIIGR